MGSGDDILLNQRPIMGLSGWTRSREEGNLASVSLHPWHVGRQWRILWQADVADMST